MLASFFRGPFPRFLFSRLLWMLATLWVVFTLSFFLMRSVDGGPFAQQGRDISEAAKEALEREYGLDLPLFEQYLLHLGRAATFNFGPSLRQEGYRVSEILGEGLPRSIALGSLALLFALALGTAAGMVSAIRRGGLLDTTLMICATLGIALPNFVIASVLILIFVISIPIFPAAGWGDVRYLILPAICLGSPFAAYLARLTRTGLLEVMSQDYIRTARAKGLRPARVVIQHALRGGLLPVISFLGPAIAGILTGSLVIEKIFAIPGIGTYFVQSAINRDYTLSMGCVMLYTTLVYSMNLLVDVCYTILDPRVTLD
ncbi:MAG: ABC transporter [Planctomycetota bacterium]|nr:MAG: ABC transporter [Planctomycetota bacterium]